MKFLLDTNVLSESVAKNPAPEVVAWLHRFRGEYVINDLVVGELHKGIEMMPEGKRKRALEAWITSLSDIGGLPVLFYSQKTFEMWGKMVGRHQRRGRDLSMADSLIAASALEHGLTVVTRNVRHFPEEVPTVNPWEE